MSRPPKPDPNLAAQRLAENHHDHVARFLCEEMTIGRGHLQISALLRAYEWWCEARRVRHRRLSPVELLDHLAENYGIVAGTVKVMLDGEDTFVYALPGIAFARDPSLSERLRYMLPTTLKADAHEAEIKRVQNKRKEQRR